MIRAVALALLLGACSATELQDYRQDRDEFLAFKLADLEVALADARAHDDRPAALCWAALIRVVERAGETGPPVGAFSAYQKARNARRFFGDDAINIACSPMVNESRDVLRRLVLLVRP